jgi:hypothetical protein
VTDPGISEKVGSVHGSGHRIRPPQLPHRWKYQNVARPAAPAMSTPATMAAIHRRRFRPMLAGAVATRLRLCSWEFMGFLIAPAGTFAYSLSS